jgi:hypothetical protein
MQLQNRLLSEHKDKVYLDRDYDGQGSIDHDLLVIRVKDGGDACHIPLKDIDEALRSDFAIPK